MSRKVLTTQTLLMVTSIDSSDEEEEEEEDDSAGTLCHGDATKTTAIEKSQFVIVLTAATKDWPHDWSLGKVVSIDKDRQNLVVQWYGTTAVKKPFTAQNEAGLGRPCDQEVL